MVDVNCIVEGCLLGKEESSDLKLRPSVVVFADMKIATCPGLYTL